LAVELALFPLGTVLFPHMPLALHIFEDRYRAMMRDCQGAGTTFGVVAIREGVEVGGPASPYRVGTLAQLRDVTELPDGRYSLIVVGASRFRIDAFSHARPYLVGSVRYLEDSPVAPDDVALLAARVRNAFKAYVSTLRGISDQDLDDVDLPDEPELLSYLVAASMQVETARRQALLELDSAAARLRACLTLLRRESVLLEQMLAGRSEHAGVVSLN
jgi:Lon protease-like protein